MRATRRILARLAQSVPWAGWMYYPFLYLHPYVTLYPRQPR